jgi:hypothetical protein
MNNERTGNIGRNKEIDYTDRFVEVRLEKE